MNFGIVYGTILFLFIIVGLTVGKANLKWFLIISDFVIAFPAFYARPVSFQYFDTIRFSDLLNQMRSANDLLGMSGGLQWAVKDSSYSNEPFIAVYLWLFSLFNNNGYLFFLSTLFFLLLLSIMLLSIKKYVKADEKSVVWTQFLVLSTFNLFFQIEGIRNFLAFMLFASAFFFEMQTTKKSKVCSFFFYIVAAFIHPSAWIFVFLRVLVSLNNLRMFHSKFYNTFVILLLLSYSVLIKPLINFLELFSTIPPVSFILQKLQTYLYGQSDFQSFASGTEILGTSVILIALCVEYAFSSMILKKRIPTIYNNFYQYLVAITLGSFASTQIYLRLIMMILFLSTFIKVNLFSNVPLNDQRDVKLVSLYRIYIAIFAIMIFIFWQKLIYRAVVL